VDISRRLRAKGYYLAYVPECTVYHKPRPTLRSYCRWNVQVGVTKYNLYRPSLFKLITQPSFLPWSILGLSGWLFFFFLRPVLAVFIVFFLWVAFLLLLYFGARPFPFLFKRRQQIGVNFLIILTVVPFLTWLRQVCINLGQIKKWHSEMKTKRRPA